MPISVKRKSTWLLYAVFFLSGAAALVFESLWFRQAGLTFGNSIWASSLVLSAFMGGLGLGNFLAARFGHRLTRPLLCYALLEIVVAVVGVALVVLLPAMDTIFTPLFQPMLDQTVTINITRLAIGFVMLLAPAAAMGATLPVLVKGFDPSGVKFGRVLGLLYGVNTLGAVAGVMVGEVWLIQWLGVRGTALVAGGANVLAAGIALFVGSSWPTAPANPPTRTRISAAAWRLLGAAFLFGFILLALEVAWFRYMLMFNGGTSRAFAVMLAVVLLGIGVGGVAASWWMRRRPDAKPAPIVAAVSGMLVIATYVSFVRLFDMSYTTDLGACLLQALRLMLPVSILSGMLFPMVGQMLHREIESPIRAAGLLTMANTLGAMLGPLIAGFVLLPTVGLASTIFVLALAYGVGALLVMSRLVQLPAIGMLIIVAALFPFDMLPEHVYPRVVERFTKDGSELVAVHEGAGETVFYLEARKHGQPFAYRQATNGMTMSGTYTRTRRYMKMFVYLPVALHPAPRKALLISYGIGVTADALVDTPWIEHIDVVDISRTILETSAIAHQPPQNNPLDDPRVNVHVEDGRFFLLTTDQRYDLITGDPPAPKAAGIGNLYSQEYFQLIYDRLAPGGMCSYRLSIEQLSPSDLHALIGAFCRVFEECSLWTANGPECVLLGVREHQQQVTEQQYTRQWSVPAVHEELVALGYELPQQLPTFFMADGRMLRQLTAQSPPLVDDFPYRLSPVVVDRFEVSPTYVDWIDPSKAAHRVRTSEHIRKLFPPEALKASMPLFAFRLDLHDAMTVHRVSTRSLQQAAVHRILTTSPLQTLALWKMWVDVDEVRLAQRAAAQGRSTPDVEMVLGHAALSRRKYNEAAAFYANARRTDARLSHLIFDEMLALSMAGRIDEAQALANQSNAANIPSQMRALWWRFARQRLGLMPPGAR